MAGNITAARIGKGLAGAERAQLCATRLSPAFGKTQSPKRRALRQPTSLGNSLRPCVPSSPKINPPGPSEDSTRARPESKTNFATPCF